MAAVYNPIVQRFNTEKQNFMDALSSDEGSFKRQFETENFKFYKVASAVAVVALGAFFSLFSLSYNSTFWLTLATSQIARDVWAFSNNAIKLLKGPKDDNINREQTVEKLADNTLMIGALLRKYC